MKITVQRKVGGYERDYEFQVAPTDTIESIQNLVACQPGPFCRTPADTINLMYQYKRLESHRVIQDYAIPNEAIIRVSGRNMAGATIQVRINYFAGLKEYKGIAYEMPATVRCSEIKDLLMEGISSCDCTSIQVGNKDLDLNSFEYLFENYDGGQEWSLNIALSAEPVFSPEHFQLVRREAHFNDQHKSDRVAAITNSDNTLPVIKPVKDAKISLLIGALSGGVVGASAFGILYSTTNITEAALGVNTSAAITIATSVLLGLAIAGACHYCFGRG